MMEASFDDVIGRWHAELAGDRAARAGLRRARTLDDVLLDGAAAAAFMRLWRHAPSKGPPYALARAALALAEIDNDMRPEGGTRAPFARRCATQGEGRVLVSPDRFRLLMGATDADEFLRLLRSAIGQVERRAPLGDVASLARFWSHEERRQWMRRDQLLAYYEAVPNSALEA